MPEESLFLVWGTAVPPLSWELGAGAGLSEGGGFKLSLRVWGTSCEELV